MIQLIQKSNFLALFLSRVIHNIFISSTKYPNAEKRVSES